jgi:glutamate--cysteine ligase
MTTTIFSDKSPPIESREDLRSIFETSEKPRDQWLVGTEHEKLGFYRDSREPVPYEGEAGIGAVLQGFVGRFGWEPVSEGDNVIALLRERASITLEPGGQLELSGAPLKTAHESCRELHIHLEELRAVSEPLRIDWLAVGRNPLTATEAMPWMPKERYAIMRRYLPGQGAMAKDMMLGTGTVQTNLDYASEEDMALKLRVAMALAPFLTALFANSPFAEGKPTGFLSTRSRIWMDTDPDRCGIIPAVFREDFGYEHYIDYALDAPMFFIFRDGHYLDYAGRSFRTFMAEGMDGQVATQQDWFLHLTTLFPEARLKNIIELRMADVGPASMICALVAFSRGLFYDDEALKSAWSLLNELEPESYPALQLEAARHALRAEAGGRALREWARELVCIAASGLERLNAQDENGEHEGKFLNPLRRIVDTGMTQADLLLERWNGEWHQQLEPLFSSEFLL